MAIFLVAGMRLGVSHCRKPAGSFLGHFSHVAHTNP